MASHGFSLLYETTVDELSSIVRLFRHGATGSQLLSFTNSDANKVFGVSFRTPPADSTGVAHILEHSVLCGSKKYPVKEPFVELLKGSLQTFLNAFTYPDKTCYPVASANVRDFRNLTDVYLDAVFFPVISRNIFRQEGWHLQKAGEAGQSGPDDGFNLKGVVYNEMKGAFSSPESVLDRYCLHALFPDTVYGLESGGDPAAIPDLTYEAFCAFHATYYHPSNARFFFWGDDNEEERLWQLGAVLNQFTAIPVDSAIQEQGFFAAPRTLTVPFAAAEEEKGMVVLNWLGPNVALTELGLGMRMLDHILTGMPASPLRRALIESGLGEDLAGKGLETELRQLTFDTGLKGVDPADADAVEDCIMGCLRGLVREGIPPEHIEAAINSVEFALRENNTGRFPVGLSVMLRALTTWLHDGDPLTPLCFEKPLAVIKGRLQTGEAYFEGLIREWLLDNPHRVRVTLAPDTGLSLRQAVEEQERVQAMTEALDQTALAALEAGARELEDWQHTPDTAEALATIPRLGIQDLPLENATIPGVWHDGESLFFHPLPTGGIVYANAFFGLETIPEETMPYLPLLGRALLEMGTRKRDFVALNMAIAAKTGGMDADCLFASRLDTAAPVARFVLEGKAAPDKVEDLFALMTEVLLEADLDQPERFLRMVLEEKAREEHSLVPSGHMVVASRLLAGFSAAGRLSEMTGGISYLFFLRELATRIQNDWPGVLATLSGLRQSLCTRAGLSMNITATPEQEGTVCALARAFAGAMPDTVFAQAPALSPLPAGAGPAGEALLLPAQVQYTGKIFGLHDAGYVWHGSALVIRNYLRTGYLWENVRVRGGAYGCVCGLDRASGGFYMVSYRDPSILPTLAVYDKMADHLRHQTPDKAALEAAIVGAIGEMDTYLLPDAKGRIAFSRHLTGETVAMRAKTRAEVLGTTAGHFKAFGQALAEAGSRKVQVAALGGDMLEKTAREAGWEQVRVL